MELTHKKSLIWSTGLAIFAMFFGAGNIIFPLALGQLTQDKNFYAIAGLIITAVLVPLAGLLGMLLFGGDYNAFFKRIGKWPGVVLIALILGLIGPFAGLPRCVVISHATLNALNPDFFSMVPLPIFSLISCSLIFVLTCRKNRIIQLLGYVLTPILLLSLAGIVLKGFFASPDILESSFTRWDTFKEGLFGGYNTMDLLAAFFFSSVVIACLRRDSAMPPEVQTQASLKAALYGSAIAALLLAFVYISFTWIAAGHSPLLKDVASHELLGTLALQLLGPYAGVIVGISVCFACLTTEIALAVVFSEYLSKTLSRGRLSYKTSLIITLITSFFISTLEFQGISSFLAPILMLCYPALIVLTIVNLLHKLFDLKSVKVPVYATFFVTLAAYIFG